MRSPRISRLTNYASPPPPPARGGLLKYIIIAAIAGMLFRAAVPAFGIFSAMNNISGGSSVSRSPIGEIGGNIGAIGGIGGSGSMLPDFGRGGFLTTKPKPEPLPEIDAAPLIQAAVDGNEELVIKLLTEEGESKIPVNGRDVQGRTALIGAAYHGHNKICELLLKSGANLDAKDKDGFTALDFAASRGLVNTVKILLNITGKTDKKNHVEYAMLMQAAFASDPRFLPEIKKNKNFASVNNISPEGKSPLHIAALNGSEEIVKILLKNGAKPNLTNPNQRTPLHWAAWNNQTGIINILLANSADIDATDKTMETPLMLAAENGNKEAIILLLKKGAKKNLMNKHNETAKNIAESRGFFEPANIIDSISTD